MTLEELHLDIETAAVQKYGLVLNHVKDKDGSFLPLEGLKLKYDNRNLSFHFTTPKFLNNKDIEYQYKLVGQMKEWTDWAKGGTFIFSSLNVFFCESRSIVAVDAVAGGGGRLRLLGPGRHFSNPECMVTQKARFVLCTSKGASQGRCPLTGQRS